MRSSKPLPRFVDLHLHTNKSDGTLSPTELVRLAHRKGIGMIAITDHDTIEGVNEGQKEADRLGLELITGVEISSQYSGGTLHILGYGLNIEHTGLQAKLKELQEARRQRHDKILLKLRDLDIAISEEELRQYDRNASSPGRPHLASVLLGKGIVEAFQQYLGKNGKAFVDKEIFSSAESIKMIHQAGGKAFVAHPVSLKREGNRLVRYIHQLCREGLNGIEVYSSSHNRRQIEEYKSVAHRMHLGISAGSDFHGAIKPSIQIGINNDGKRTTSDLISMSTIPP